MCGCFVCWGGDAVLLCLTCYIYMYMCFVRLEVCLLCCRACRGVSVWFRVGEAVFFVLFCCV